MVFQKIYPWLYCQGNKRIFGSFVHHNHSYKYIHISAANWTYNIFLIFKCQICWANRLKGFNIMNNEVRNKEQLVERMNVNSLLCWYVKIISYFFQNYSWAFVVQNRQPSTNVFYNCNFLFSRIFDVLQFQHTLRVSRNRHNIKLFFYLQHSLKTFRIHIMQKTQR